MILNAFFTLILAGEIMPIITSLSNHNNTASTVEPNNATESTTIMTDLESTAGVISFSDDIRSGRYLTEETLPNDLKIVLNNDPITNSNSTSLPMSTMLSSIETTTEYISAAINSSSSSAQITTTISQQATSPTTLSEAFNTTFNTTDAFDNNTLNNEHETVSKQPLNSQLMSLGLVAAAQGIMAGTMHGITTSISQHFESRGHLTSWRKPLTKASIMLANAIAISTLPLLLSTVEDEAEQSNFLNKIQLATAYSFGSSLILNGVNLGAQWAYSYFNKKPMDKDCISNKVLNALPLLTNTGLLVHGGYPIDEATVIVGANTIAAGLTSGFTQMAANHFFRKTRKNSKNDIEMGSNNNIPNDEANCFSSSFTKESANFSGHENNKATIDTNVLKNSMKSFIFDLKLNTKGFNVKSGVFKTENNYSFEKIDISYGLKILSIFIPTKLEHDSDNKHLLITIDQSLKKLFSNDPKNMISLKYLFIVPFKSTIAVAEIVIFSNRCKSSDKITVYTLDSAFKGNFNSFSDIAKKYKCNYKLEKNVSHLSGYYFIKNSVINYLKDCVLPNNSAPDFLEGLLATFIKRLELNDLKFEIEKINSTENDDEENLTPIIKNTPITEKEMEQKTATLVRTIDRKRNKAIAVCQTTNSNNTILSIFKSIPPDNSANSKSPRKKVIDRLLKKRKSEIQNNEVRRDFLIFANEKGIALIEVITKKELSSLLIHDPLQLIANTKLIGPENGYHYKYNPSEYSLDWKSEERCQLAAYYFIKEAALCHLGMKTEPILNDTSFPEIILNEISTTLKLDLNNENDINELEIKRCDGGVFSLKNYIADVNNYLTILNIETTPTRTNPSHCAYTDNQRASLFNRANALKAEPNSPTNSPVLPSHSTPGYK